MAHFVLLLGKRLHQIVPQLSILGHINQLTVLASVAENDDLVYFILYLNTNL